MLLQQSVSIIIFSFSTSRLILLVYNSTKALKALINLTSVFIDSILVPVQLIYFKIASALILILGVGNKIREHIKCLLELRLNLYRKLALC